MTDLKPCPFCDKGHTLKLITAEKMRQMHVWGRSSHPRWPAVTA